LSDNSQILENRMQQLKSAQRQLGQGMTEYIIIVALIAIAAIGVYQFFGQTVRSQTSAIVNELAGQDGTTAINAAKTAAEATTKERDSKGLSNYAGGAKLNTTK
jgi:Flp pilus assembly pilin Flp